MKAMELNDDIVTKMYNHPVSVPKPGTALSIFQFSCTPFAEAARATDSCLYYVYPTSTGTQMWFSTTNYSHL